MTQLGKGPLAGIQVLDLSRVLAGPLTGQVLADFGAEVIKIEHPERGDDTRDWGMRIGATETTYFNSVNRNKKSLTLNLQTNAGADLARELAAVCDVVIQNFKPGGADQFGLGYEALSAINPALVYCSISGYDQKGKEGSRPGYDLVIQGEAGLMAMNGEAGQPRLKFGVAVVDLFTGMYAAQAVMAALIERGRTGKGRHVQLALFDCGLALTSYYGLEALLDGKDPPRYGNAHPSIVPYGVFEAADGPLVITIGTTRQFASFCIQVIDRADLAEDPRFSSNFLRSQNRRELLPVIDAELAKRSRADLLRALSDNGIPCGEVLGLLEALNTDRARDAGMVTAHAHPMTGSVDLLAPPYRLDGERCAVRLRPPLLGEHSREILSGLLGKTPDQINSLMETGIVRKEIS
jgi:crotonobetainyl-CoA:carnitine CoA-transferase CaiB-like acyl-CoA transferase